MNALCRIQLTFKAKLENRPFLPVVNSYFKKAILKIHKNSWFSNISLKNF